MCQLLDEPSLHCSLARNLFGLPQVFLHCVSTSRSFVTNLCRLLIVLVVEVLIVFVLLRSFLEYDVLLQFWLSLADPAKVQFLLPQTASLGGSVHHLCTGIVQQVAAVDIF